MNHCLRWFAAAWALSFALLATAQPAYPVKPIRLIVPFPAGGTIDLVARTVGERMHQTLGQPIVVDNRPGANGNIGADVAAKSAPDGYTLLMGTNATHTINPALYPKMPYDAMKDFVPIARIASAPNVLVVHPSVPAKTMQEFIALAKAKPGSINYASGGSGSTGHLGMELLKTSAGIDLLHVPYKGGPAAITDTVGGHAMAVMFPPPALLAHIKSGKVRALAVTGSKRSPLLPDVPTMAEAGLGDVEVVAWYGLFAPAATPAPIVARLTSEVAKALEQPEVRQKIVQQGAEVDFVSGDGFAAFLKTDAVKWAKVVKDSGATVD